jgi:hypothetical protein
LELPGDELQIIHRLRIGRLPAPAIADSPLLFIQGKDRPEIPIFLLEPALVFPQEALKIIDQHPVEDRPFRMARAVDSRHIGRAVSKSMPGTREERSGSTRKNPTTIGDARGKKERDPSAATL